MLLGLGGVLFALLYPYDTLSVGHRAMLVLGGGTILISFGITLFSVVYGIISGNKQKGEDVLDILSYGLRQGSSLIIIYIFAIQLYASLRFVFG